MAEGARRGSRQDRRTARLAALDPGDAFRFRPRVKVWVERGDAVALSVWRVKLLEAIESTGSISAAARELNVPYRTAWYKLRQVEESLGVKLLDTHSGGAEGGHSRLTPAARTLVDAFVEFSRGLDALIDERFIEVFGAILTDPPTETDPHPS